MYRNEETYMVVRNNNKEPSHYLIGFPSFLKQYCYFIELPAVLKTLWKSNNLFSFLAADFLLQLQVNFGCTSCLHEPDRRIYIYDNELHTHDHCASKVNS